jgi:DNA-binding NtrC family response regulator
VIAAAAVQEAESILHKRKFNVVVSDHLMPGGNGMSFLMRTREEYPEMQRVLVTAYMKPEMLLRSVNEAGLGFFIRMRERHPQTLRILLTGYLNPELLSRSMRVAELSACLLKPVRAAELARAVHAAVGR